MDRSDINSRSKIMRNLITGAMLAFLPFAAIAQADSTAIAQIDSVALNYAGSITVEELRKHLEIIASDEYEGRDTGKEGQKKAAAYLKEQFASFGIAPLEKEGIDEGYFQRFPLIEERMGSISIRTSDSTFRFLEEIIYFNEFLKSDRKVEELIFLGEGKDMAAVKKDATVLLVDDGTAGMIEFMGWLKGRADEARAAGAAVVLVSTPRVDEIKTEMGHFLTGTRMRLADGDKREQPPAMQTILIEKAAMSQLLRTKKKIKEKKLKAGKVIPVDLTLKHTSQRQEVISENVLAFIEGTEKPEEILVLTAHYDHVGMEGGDIYNGADDDGSGTVALIEMAQAFAEAKKAGHGPRRSVLVMPVSAEEKGLLGSKYYSENPVFPLENTIANLNIDMIGRTDSVHAGGEPYVYIIGSDRLSTQLHEVNEKANSTYCQLDLDYTFNAEDDPNKFYYRSDHYNFAKKGVPAIFYFSGVHEDYHKPTDTIEKIEFDRLHQRTLLVFHTAWILANQEERIVVDKPIR